MTTSQILSLFISSKMQELTDERRAVQDSLSAFRMKGWLWEDDAGARPESIRSTYLKEVEACDIYLGLFWQGYGPYTIEEYRHARAHNKPCLIYEKHVDLAQRSPELTAFLKEIGQVDNPEGLTIRRFEIPTQLATFVQEDVMRFLTTTFRESRQQPAITIWNITAQRNLLFTGREELLQRLHDTFNAATTTIKRQAISGLGGMGKTQTALEYAYRHHSDYQAVLWAKAHARDSLLADFVAIAGVLQLPEHTAKDQNEAVTAVKRWLETHSRWLLILDNADDLNMVQAFLPAGGEGHILLTTRAQATGTIARVELEKMSPDDGEIFLLRRASIVPTEVPLDAVSPADHRLARTITEALDGLPLALDQAGAYIQETGCGLAGYWDLYQTERAALLQERGAFDADHPEPVATTWLISFDKVVKANPAAAELLSFCAFLAPDAIPLELITQGAPELGAELGPVATKPLQLNAAVKELLKYSLVRRDTNTLSIHRLVQAVIQDAMPDAIHKALAERAVRILSLLFPDPEVASWPLCQRYLPHALVCTSHIQQWDMRFSEARTLLYQTGYYLYQRGQYTEVEDLWKHCLLIEEHVLGPEHPDTLDSLNNLAILYMNQGKYELAEPLYQRALASSEHLLGLEHPDTLKNLNNLAELYRNQGKYELAEPLYQRALAARERLLGPEHPETLSCLNNLALLYADQGKYKQAESLLQHTLATRERVIGPEHPDTLNSLNNLANLYAEQGKCELAEPLYQRALASSERVLGPKHTISIHARNNYTNLLEKMKQQ